MPKFKILLLFIALLLGAAQFSTRIVSLVTPDFQLFGMIAYLGLLTICVIGIVSAAFIPNAWIRWTIGIGLSLAGIVVSSYERTASDHMPYDAYINMMNASGAFHEAWAQYSGAIIISIIQALLLCLGIGLSSDRTGTSHSRKLTAAPIVVIAALTATLFVRGGDGARGLPASYTGSSYALLFGYERATRKITPREPVSIAQGHNFNGNRDIVLLVDESISGQYLDINNPDGVRSGLLGGSDHFAIHNFGLAASISHCSAAVNYTLRHGGTREAYQQINNGMPSIWSYAKKVGMETIYIDVPRTGRAFNNLMNKEELQDIDHWIQFDDIPIQSRDHAAADSLVKYLNDGKQQFIYVNKIGAHFPIHDKYPDDYMQYKPALPRGNFLNISDTGNRDGFTGSDESWRRYRNSYRNTLLWNVGAFFDRVLSQSKSANATIIYTADHGQNLHETDSVGEVTHCSPNPRPEEGLVPLVVLESGTSVAESQPWDWAKAAAQQKNKQSHYQIFPTLLEMMGYESKAVKDIYGADLWMNNNDPFSFNYQFNARLGRSPQWRKIDLNKIAGPPVTD